MPAKSSGAFKKDPTFRFLTFEYALKNIFLQVYKSKTDQNHLTSFMDVPLRNKISVERTYVDCTAKFSLQQNDGWTVQFFQRF